LNFCPFRNLCDVTRLNVFDASGTKAKYLKVVKHKNTTFKLKDSARNETFYYCARIKRGFDGLIHYTFLTKGMSVNVQDDVYTRSLLMT